MTIPAFELQVPLAPGPVPKLGPPGFTEADYEGRLSSATVCTRMAWVPDPLGGPDPVLKTWVNDGDRADQFDGGTSYARAESWWTPQNQTLQVGDRFWIAFSFLLGDGVKGDLFRQPSGWALGFFQLHPPVGDTSMLSPAVCLDLDVGKITWRTHGVISNDYLRGRRQWILAEVLVGDSSSNGGSQLWHGVDAPPDVDAAPKLPWKAYKTGSSQGGISSNPALKGRNWPKGCGLYRLDGASDAASFPWVGYTYSWALQPTKELAIERGWRTMVAPPPPPQDTLPLTIVSQDATTVTVGWTPPVGAVGYRFRKDGGKWSHTWDGSRSSVKFGKPYTRLEVEALAVKASGDLP